jgi:hypothetical protein
VICDFEENLEKSGFMRPEEKSSSLEGLYARTNPFHVHVKPLNFKKPTRGLARMIIPGWVKAFSHLRQSNAP